MPPRDKGTALSKQQVATIERWIKEGAKLDDGVDPKAELVRELRVRRPPPAPPEKYAFPASVSALAFSRDGKKLATGGHHEVTVWELPTEAGGAPKLVQRVRTRAERTLGLAFLPDGRLVAAGGRPGYEGDVRVYDLGGKPEKVVGGVAHLDGTSPAGSSTVLSAHLFDTDDVVSALALSADGKRLAAASDRAVRVWDVTGAAIKLEHTVENHADWVLGVALSEDGRYLFTASRDKSAKVWDLANKQSVVTFADHQNVVYGVAAGARGQTGYSVGADRQVRSWKLDGDGRQLKSYGGHNGEVLQIASSPAGGALATASADKTVRIWAIRPVRIWGAQVASAVAPGKTFSLTDHAQSVAFDPQGVLVAAGGYDGEVRVWRVADGTPVTGFNASPGQPTKYAQSK